MFQLGVGLVGDDCDLGEEEKNKKSAVDHIQISDTLLHCVSICFFGNKALGRMLDVVQLYLIIYGAGHEKRAPFPVMP